MRTLKEYIKWAEDKNIAIGHFNISDSEGFKAVVESAQSLEVPVIIGLSEGEMEFIGLDEAVAMVGTAQSDGLPVFLNADHAYSVEGCKEAIDAGADCVIIDMAGKPMDENIRATKEVVEYAREKGDVLVEAEIGFIGRSSKELDEIPEGVSEETQTNPETAAMFVEETGVDLLAPSVGNVHGIIRTGPSTSLRTSNPKLNIERIREIKQAAGVPLVLHGGSGVSDEDFLAAIDAGISIVHINTEMRLAYKRGIKAGLDGGEVAPYKFLKQGVEEMKKVITNRLRLFNRL